MPGCQPGKGSKTYQRVQKSAFISFFCRLSAMAVALRGTGWKRENRGGSGWREKRLTSTNSDLGPMDGDDEKKVGRSGLRKNTLQVQKVYLWCGGLVFFSFFFSIVSFRTRDIS